MQYGFYKKHTGDTVRVVMKDSRDPPTPAAWEAAPGLPRDLGAPASEQPHG